MWSGVEWGFEADSLGPLGSTSLLLCEGLRSPEAGPLFSYLGAKGLCDLELIRAWGVQLRHQCSQG